MNDKLTVLLEAQQLSKYPYRTKVAVLGSITEYRSDCRRVVFLGDSLTDFGEWNEMFHKEDIIIYNRGISGDTIKGIQNRLDSVACLHPHKIFLMIGLNNLSMAQEVDETAREYRRLVNSMIEKCHIHSTQIFLQSVLPINAEMGRNPYLRGNEKIIVLNKEISALAEKRGLTYIDVYSVMLDGKGQLDVRYTIDGAHLNSAGYAVWFSCIRDMI